MSHICSAILYIVNHLFPPFSCMGNEVRFCLKIDIVIFITRVLFHLMNELSLFFQMNDLHNSLESRISALEKLKQIENSEQVEATE